jgi:simple sugar transport system substrate-binding protein
MQRQVKTAHRAACRAWILVFSLALFVSCATSPQEPEGKTLIGFSQFGHASEWRVALSESIQDSFKSDGRFRLIYSDANQSQDSQIRALRAFITKKVDVILFTPMVEGGYGPVLAEAAQAGILVITVDRDVAVEDRPLRLARIVSDFEKEGERTGTWLAEYLKDQAIDDGTKQITIVELRGPSGTEAVEGRGEGFRHTLRAHSNWRITQSLPADFTRSKAKAALATLLKAASGIQVVHAQDDQMALGAIDAIKEAGLKPGKDIIVVSEDATNEGLMAVTDGSLSATAECSPFVGPQVLQAVNDVLQKKSIPSVIWTVEGFFDKTNAAEALTSHKY